MRFATARHRLFTSVVVLTLLQLPLFDHSKAVYAADWAENYRHRPVDEEDLKRLTAIYESSNRKILNLNGQWEGRKSGEEEWKPVQVPGIFDFDGVIEFQRSFLLDSTFVNHAFKLVALGINNRCTFFLNGEFVGGHVGGQTSFSLEIDRENLRVGASNELQVRVDNAPRSRSSIPVRHSPGLPLNYGGIARDIFILALPKVYVDELVVRKDFQTDFSQCQISLAVKLRNKLGRTYSDSLNLKLHAELWDLPSKRKLVESESVALLLDRNVLDRTLALSAAGFKLWTPENPRLYELKTIIKQGTLIYDEKSIKIGFNSISVSGDGFVLNGNDLDIAGVELVEGTPSTGPAIGWKAIREQVLRAKELGVNAIRVLGPPPHPFIFEICDELGMFVLEEMPLVLAPPRRFEERSFVEQTNNYFKEMVARDAHHPSLLAWGLGTDLPTEAPQTQIFLKSLQNLAQGRSERPTFLAIKNMDSLAPDLSVDFLFFQSFGKEPDAFWDQVNGLRSAYSDKPLMCSYGFPYLLDTHAVSSADDAKRNGELDSPRLTPVEVKYQEIQAQKLRQALLSEDVKGKLAGIFIHTLADWQESKPNLLFATTNDPTINKSGLMSIDAGERFAFEVITSELVRNQQIQIPVHDEAEGHPIAFPIVGIVVIIVFLFNFNRSRSLRGNIRRIFIYPHGFYTELKDKRKVSVFHTFLLSLVLCSFFGVVAASTSYYLRQNAVFNDFLSLLIGSNGVKLQVIRLIWHPLLCISVVTAISYIFCGFIILFLKFSGFAFDRNLSFVQFFTLVFWAGANFVWLLPVVPIYYRIVNETTWSAAAIVLVLVFMGWFAARLFRGSKVVFDYMLTRTLFLFAVLCVICLSVLGFYYQSKYAFFDYLPTYWSLATSHYF